MERAKYRWGLVNLRSPFRRLFRDRYTERLTNETQLFPNELLDRFSGSPFSIDEIFFRGKNGNFFESINSFLNYQIEGHIVN